MPPGSIISLLHGRRMRSWVDPASHGPYGRSQNTSPCCQFLSLTHRWVPQDSVTSQAVFPYQDNYNTNAAVTSASISKKLLTAEADKSRWCLFSSVLGQHALNPKGISKGHIRLEMPSGRMAQGNTCCYPGSGCSNGPRAEINSSPAQLPLVTQHTDMKQDTYCITEPLKSTSRALSHSCDRQCHQRPLAVWCLELEYQ